MKNILNFFILLWSSAGFLQAQCPETCSQSKIVLSGTLSNMTLSASNTYLLSGCVIVPNNVTLTIPAGTVIMGETSSSGTLLIEKGGKLVSEGTSTNPVIFTSDQAEACLAPGNWGGIILAGTAPNNDSNNIVLTGRTCNPITAGGTHSNDSSGVLRYMRIEYAEQGLTLISVGDKTIIENIEIAYSAENAMELMGGTVPFRNMVYFNNYGHDLYFTLGNTSLAQRLLFIRTDENAYTGSGSSALQIKNNDDAGNNYVGFPTGFKTHPVISNFTILGPEYCDEKISNNYQGVHFLNNGAGEIYNGYIDGINVGVSIDGNTTIDNANRLSGPELFFEYISLNNYRTLAQSSGTWSGGCVSNIQDWLNGLFPCRQQGIETGVAENLSTTLCANYCETTPVLTLTSSDLSFDLKNLSDPFFEEIEVRGALDHMNWASSWTQFCPEDYCTILMKTSGKAFLPYTGMDLYPNPAHDAFYISLDLAQEQEVQVVIFNTLGQMVHQSVIPQGMGRQNIKIPTTHWPRGMYQVQVREREKTIHQAKLIAR